MGRIGNRELKIFLTVFLLAGLFTHWYGVNELSRFTATMSFVDEGNANINEYYWKAGDRSYYEGDYYSDKEPGMAFLATPIYWSWKNIYSLAGGDTSINSEDRQPEFNVGNETIYSMSDPGDFYLSSLILVVLLTSTLSLAILTVLIYRLSQDFVENESKRLLLTFGFAFGTLVTNYGTNFMPNTVVTLFSFSAFYLVYKSSKAPSSMYLGFAGTLGGLAVIIDPTAAPVAAGTFIYSLMKYDFVPYQLLVGNFIGVLPLLVYNTVLFGYPWMLPRFFLDPALFPQLQQSSDILPQLTEQGFRFDALELIFIIGRLLFMPHRGIFFWFPLLILALWSFKEFFKDERQISYVLVFVTLTTTFMVGAWWAWWMGGFFGARYLAVITPFLMIPVFHASNNVDIKILAGLVAVSILINLSGFTGFYEDELKDLENSSEMKPEYQEKVKTLQPLSNPIRDHYLPLMLNNGLESPIVNGLYNGDLPPDIRVYNSYEDRAPQILLVWIIFLIVSTVWMREISGSLKRHRENVLDNND